MGDRTTRIRFIQKLTGDVIVARLPRFGSYCMALTAVACFVWSLSVPAATAQSGKSKSKPARPASSAEVKQIDARLQKLQDTFETESKAIIDGYERSGQYDRAKFLLEVLLKLDPKNEELKTKIADFEKLMLDKSGVDFKFDAGSDWTAVGLVMKDSQIRIEAAGEYKLILNMSNVSADGITTENPMRDLVGKVPTGALMGMVVTEENQQGKQPAEAFAIKSKHEFTAKKEGTLFLKVNVPPGSKCIGDLKIKMSGVVRNTER